MKIGFDLIGIYLTVGGAGGGRRLKWTRSTDSAAASCVLDAATFIQIAQVPPGGL